jgi:hypothetical protein
MAHTFTHERFTLNRFNTTPRALRPIFDFPRLKMRLRKIENIRLKRERPELLFALGFRASCVAISHNNSSPQTLHGKPAISWVTLTEHRQP